MLRERPYSRIAVANSTVFWHQVVSVGITCFLGNPCSYCSTGFALLQGTGREETIASSQTCSFPWTINSLLLACLDCHLQSIPRWSYLDKTSITVNVKPDPVLLAYYKTIAPQLFQSVVGLSCPSGFESEEPLLVCSHHKLLSIQVVVNTFYSFNHWQSIWQFFPGEFSHWLLINCHPLKSFTFLYQYPVHKH